MITPERLFQRLIVWPEGLQTMHPLPGRFAIFDSHSAIEALSKKESAHRW